MMSIDAGNVESRKLEFASDPWSVTNRKPNVPLFGLCAFETNIFCNRDVSTSLIFLRYGKATACLLANDAMEAVGSNLWKLKFHIVTHLIPNGSHDLSCSLRWSDRTEVNTAAQSFVVSNTGALAENVRRDLESCGTPAIIGPVIDSRLFPSEGASNRAWFNDPNALPDVSLSFEPAPHAEAARSHLMRWGFCVLNSEMPAPLIDAFNLESSDAIVTGALQHKHGSGERIHGAHFLPSGRDIWLFAPVLEFLRGWFRDEPSACQTLLYMNGSEQNAHQDTIHLTPYPAGYMCGVWIALEDVAEGSGELFVYPGSHRSPRLMSASLGLAKVSTDYSSYAAFDRRVAELMRDGGYERHAYRPKKGQILVWHENLVHGGSSRTRPEITRRSIVSHYFAKGGLAYYDSRGEAAVLEAPE
jgi:hypothetical protein